MASDLEAAIAATQDALQPLFAKPRLTSKLLAKPPFRFLHDIVTATLRATGFPPDGYFIPRELDASCLKDAGKAAKVAFLDKLIRLVAVGCGAGAEAAEDMASATKIVAGLEPRRTNALLAAFGRLARDDGLDREALLRRCLGGAGEEEEEGVDDGRLRGGEEGGGARRAVGVADGRGGGRAGEAAAAARAESDPRRALAERVEASCNEDLARTRSVLSGLVARPKCSDKLLGKPPFRFLHDLVTAIGAATGLDLRRIFR